MYTYDTQVDANIGELQDLFDRPNALDGFSELGCLGRGAFGQALLMRGPSNLLFVAKRVDLRGISAHQMQRLETEVAVCAKLRHPHICHYLGTVARADALLICLEHAAGGNLSDRIDHARAAASPFGTPTATAWVAQICAAVSYMHSMHVLHRDLSAPNVFLSHSGRIKVGDFGLSKANATSRSVLGRTTCGTPNYFSPEMVNGRPYGTASDAWSVGLLAHEILTLRHPFANASSLASLLQKISTCSYDRRRLENAPYPEDVKAVASSEQLLHPDPDARATPGEILARPAFKLALEAGDAPAAIVERGR